MIETTCRMDMTRSDSKEATVVYACRGGVTADTASEFLASIYPVLTEGDTVATDFELTVFRLHPKEPVNFEKNLFDQPMLAPMLPPIVTYPMNSTTLKDAMDQAKVLFDYFRLWAWVFPEQLPHPNTLILKAA